MLSLRSRPISKLPFALHVRRYQHRTPAPPPREISKLIADYSAQPSRPLNLSTLLSFGRPLTPTSVLASVNYVLAELPRRLANRVRSLEALPFIVGTNPYVASMLNAYRENFRLLSTYPPVQTLEENARFAAQLEGLVQSHANDIPTMAKGFQECSRYMSPTQVSNFLDDAIRNRIAIRLIAEQHIALSQALNNPELNSTHVGVVNLVCSPRDMIHMCASFVGELCEATLGSSPSVVVDGHVDATFPYIPVHIEYMLTEILKNSFRATVEHHQKQGKPTPLPPVRITISPPSNAPGNIAGTSFLSLRVRDQGGGVKPSNMARIFSYAFTTAGRGAGEEDGGPYAAQHVGGAAAIGGDNALFGEITGKSLQTGMGTIAGLGYGLPMSRLYARYFGGSFDLLSLDGWGSDAFLKLRCLNEAVEGHV